MTRLDATDRKFMAEALRLGARGRGKVSPNPMVGAVLVRNGHILARGFHKAYGAAHAEVDCLSRYHGPLDGTTLYVNLEPCAHYGKTPPCAALLASSGIARIVVAIRDPNPRVIGKGVEMLRAAGKRVDVGVLAEEARELNRVFIRSMVGRRPYVHVKIAQTLDGKIGDRGRRVAITGPESQRLVHKLRSMHDAVLVGSGTIRIDDPMLTVRDVRGRDPHVVVLDGGLHTRPTARIFSSGTDRKVIVCIHDRTARRHPTRVRRLVAAGARVIQVSSRGERFSVGAVLERLWAEEIGSMLVEGGQEVFTEFLASGLVDEISLFIAMGMAGRGLTVSADTPWSGAEGVMAARTMKMRRLGKDLYIHTMF